MAKKAKKIKTLDNLNLYDTYQIYLNKKYSDYDSNYFNFISIGPGFFPEQNTYTFLIFLRYNKIKIDNHEFTFNYSYLIMFITPLNDEKLYLLYDLNENNNDFTYKTIEFEKIKQNVQNYVIHTECNLLEKTNLNVFNKETIKNIIQTINIFVKDYSKNNYPNLNYSCTVKFYVIMDDYKSVFPFWNETVYIAGNDKTNRYHQSKNIFTFLKFKFNANTIWFLNIIGNYNLSSSNSFIEETIKENKNIIVQNKIIIEYYLILFLKKNNIFIELSRRFISSNSNLIKYKNYLSLISFNSLKALGWAFFKNYISNTEKDLLNSYSFEEYSMYRESNFLGIQYLEDSNIREDNWNKIYLNLKNNKYKNWEDDRLLDDIKDIKYLTEYDINSAYTYAAKTGVKYGPTFKYNFKTNNYWNEIKNLNGFAFVIIEDFTDDLIYLPIRHHFSRQVFCNVKGKYFGWYNISELLQIEKFCKIEVLQCFEIGFSRNILFDFIQEFEVYLDTDYRSDIKFILNSVYGMFSFKRKKIEFQIDDKKKESKKNVGKQNINVFNEDLEEKSIRITQSDNLGISKYFPLSTFITVENRKNLRNYLFNTKKMNGKIFHVNIDSFWTDIKLPTSKKQGELKIKNDNKKVIFFNVTTYINFTDKYFVFNNVKYYDLNKISYFIEKGYFVLNREKKEEIDFTKNFSSKVLSLKTKKKRLLSTDFEYFKDIDSYKVFSKILSKIEDKIKELKILKDTEDNLNDLVIEISFLAIRFEILTNSYTFDFYYKNAFIVKMFDSWFAKFDAIYFNWLESYDSDEYQVVINFKMLNRENLIELYSEDIIIKENII